MLERPSNGVTRRPHKRIGVLTSGGDCAGLNSVIRAVVHRAIRAYGWEVLGIRRGTDGLLARPVQYTDLDYEAVAGMVYRMGGTILGTTNRGDPFDFPTASGGTVDRSDEAIEGYRQLRLDALIGVGGDGSISILRRLAQKGGLNLVAVPKTIDNDVGITEQSIGYQTAVAIATEALDRLHFTAASHSRVMIVEVMGRDAGHIAISAGIAGNADVILIPEIPYTFDGVCAAIAGHKRMGQNFSLIVVAEAVKTVEGQVVTSTHGEGEWRYGGIGHYLGNRLSELTGDETRVTVLGHVQRGGDPVPIDRLIGSAFGVAAVDLLAEERYDRMVAWQHRQVVDVPIADAIIKPSMDDAEGTLVKTARALGISFGD